MRSLARLQPYAIAFIRIAIGISMVYNSWSKVYPADGLRHAYLHHALLAPERDFNLFVAHLGLPAWLGYFSTATEFLGGLCLVLGFLTRFWAALTAINMLVALAAVNIHHGYTGSQYSIALIAMALLLVTTGAGAPSVDRRFGIT